MRWSDWPTSLRSADLKPETRLSLRIFAARRRKADEKLQSLLAADWLFPRSNFTASTTALVNAFPRVSSAYMTTPGSTKSDNCRELSFKRPRALASYSLRGERSSLCCSKNFGKSLKVMAELTHSASDRPGLQTSVCRPRSTKTTGAPLILRSRTSARISGVLDRNPATHAERASSGR